MAKFDSKTFNPEAFGKYMTAIPNVKLNKLRESRAVVGDERLRETFKNNSQTGTVYATIPYFGLLGGEAQNYDGVNDLTPETTTTYDQGVFTYGRMNGWTEADFSYDVTGGTDFMANVRRQINDYWNSIDQDVLLSILKGIFGMSATGTNKVKEANAEFVEAHTLDISAEGAEHTTEAMCMSATTLNTAIQKACGDNKSKFSLVFCHSSVSTNLENLKLLTYLKYTDAEGIERDLAMGTWNGRIVVIDDSLPYEVVPAVEANEGGGIKAQDAYTKYTTYILGEGAIGFEDVGVKVPYEMSRDPKTRGGVDTLISRKRNAVSVGGVSYTKASQATNSPTNAELENGKNWTLVNDGKAAIPHKAVPIARIISRG
ncbi:MAG: phage coat protein [Lachnospiraceae bacterium]|nr:phage coat protein [Lachnospiraceae bacterium]